MCKAFVLRFCCGHGILMSLEPCRLGPCPMIKSCGEKLPQQPYRCYNCQHKRVQRSSRPNPFGHRIGSSTSCAPEASRLDEHIPTPVQRASTVPNLRSSLVSHTLPGGIAKQPAGTLQFGHCRKSSSNKTFSFTCSVLSSCSDHLPTPPHYSSLPSFLPHQNHACPPCQLSELRQLGEREVARQASTEYPRLTVDMLIRNGTLKEWQPKPTFDQYLDERLTEEREMWLHVTRKWIQDLRKIRVLVAEEDGMGLMG